MTGFQTELRVTLRRLRRTPVPTLAAVLSLALGIGATTAIFTAVRAALLDTLPFREPGRLVSVFRTTPHFDTGPFSAPNFLDLRDAAGSFDSLAAVATGTMHLEVGDRAERVTVARASGDLFRLLGAGALQGRPLVAGDDDPASPWVAVVGEELWRERLGGDAGAVGGTFRLDGRAFQVVGVLPRGFRLPHGGRIFGPEVWIPLRFTEGEAAGRRSNFLSVVGRLGPGVDLDAAGTELTAAMAGIVEQHPELTGEGLRVASLHGESVRSLREPLVLLQGAVALVLLIGVANAASLLLARAASRRGELGVRAALGAGAREVHRLAYLEGAVVSAAGGALGVLLAWSCVEIIGALVPQSLPQLADLGLDLRVLGFAAGVSVLVTLLVGAAPSWQARRTDPQEALRGEGRSGGGPGQHRFLRGLVVAEVALSLVLLLGAGLVLRGFVGLVRQPPGFDPEPLLALEVSVPPAAAGEGSSYDRFLQPALAAVRALPGVEAAAAISLIPYDNWGWNFNIRYEGRPEDDPTRLPLVETRQATPALFETLGLPLLRGRGLSAADEGEDRPAVVVVNQALAERDFPGEDPVGKRFWISDTELATIVGVVADSKNVGPDRPPFPAAYWSWGQQAREATSFPLVVRVSGDPEAFAPDVVAAIRTVDRRAAVSRVRPMERVIADSLGRPRFYLALLGWFAGVALVLALGGLYGVMSYYVAQRRRELGVRSALGGTPAALVRWVAAQGLGLVAAGLVLGLAAGWGATRLLGGLLYGTSPLDAPTWTAVAALLLLAAALAVVGPARRAGRADPLTALRGD